MTTASIVTGPATESGQTLSTAVTPRGFRIEATDLRRVVPRGRRRQSKVLLDDASLTIQPGELVAIVGGSGAGKSTLLNTLAGVLPPTSGRVTYNGVELYQHLPRFRSALGYVPQDDIVHGELTVRRTLEYAAKLRLPASAGANERGAAVNRSLSQLGLEGQADQPVHSLSGGQRKRTSIGVELLTKPRVFFLDEPTSGLDPATGRELLRELRRLSHDQGSTIVLTTHAPQDIALCDRVIFLARGGRLVFDGTPQEALEYFEVRSYDEIYDQIAVQTPERWTAQHRSPGMTADFHAETSFEHPGDEPDAPGIGPVRQWLVLTQRYWEILTRNTLTLAILVGCPLAIIGMFVVLFRPGAFAAAQPNPASTLMILFWMSFGAFFFGLTYGLLTISTELAIVRRERLVNLRIVPYIFSKVAVLLPVLCAVLAVELAVLRQFERLPSGGLDVYVPLFVSVFVSGCSALAMGLLASAAVSDPVQATLALPMLSFPQVLFSGGMLAVPTMATAGQFLSNLMCVRWTFEAMGSTTKLNALYASDRSGLGSPLLAQYGESFSGPAWESWLIMGGFTAILLVACCLVLARRTVARS